MGRQFPQEGRLAVKVRSSIRSLARQPGAQVIRRGTKVLVINKDNPRSKARQG
ncbi:50S ribosomal protein L36 [Amycolatopsis sp. NPDC004747]